MEEIRTDRLKAVLVNYEYTPTWVQEYDLDYLIYDRSESDCLEGFRGERIVKTENRGNVDYDKLTFLVDNYDHLPDVFLWGKTNLFKYISKEEFDQVKDNKAFTPLLSKNHKTYEDKRGPVCFYKDGMYHERNDEWYLQQFEHAYTWNTWAPKFGLPSPAYIPFAPGGNYILTRDTVHKYSRDLYREMQETLPYCRLPGEAHLAERSYYLLWQ
jgi:hypothetical protein